MDLTHNDYLDLNGNQSHQSKLRESISQYPVGSRASRLLCSKPDIFQSLEQDFSSFKGTESSLFFGSGYAANESLLTALSLKGCRFIRDELCHASLIDGIRNSPIPKSLKKVFSHNNLNSLESLLNEGREYINIVVTESIFSMDGDKAPVEGILDLLDKYDGILVLDEAHSIGVEGLYGRGLLESSGRSYSKVITINPCGKALGAQGAFISGPKWLIKYMVNTSRKFIYTTASSPWIAIALKESLPIVSSMTRDRAKLSTMAIALRQELTDLGFDTLNSDSCIVPVRSGTEEQTLEAATFLQQQGILVSAIRPPTVPPGSSRLRMCLNSGLNHLDLKKLIASFKRLKLEYYGGILP